jgi:hypothetical protein
MKALRDQKQPSWLIQKIRKIKLKKKKKILKNKNKTGSRF